MGPAPILALIKIINIHIICTVGNGLLININLSYQVFIRSVLHYSLLRTQKKEFSFATSRQNVTLFRLSMEKYANNTIFPNWFR